jgi:hypothetical protein
MGHICYAFGFALKIGCDIVVVPSMPLDPTYLALSGPTTYSFFESCPRFGMCWCHFSVSAPVYASANVCPRNFGTHPQVMIHVCLPHSLDERLFESC